MTLQELMQLCFNAGRESAQTPNDEGWRPWWQIYGRERHDAFLHPPEGEELTDELREISPGVSAKRERDFKESPGGESEEG